MAAGRLGKVIGHLRGAFEQAADASLLERFLTCSDEAAFEALVRRHGPMVLGVCRRVLGNPEDAEDAFQATFLVLAKKAASVRNRGVLSNWLYGVAHRTALHARRAVMRRRQKEACVMPPQSAGADAWDGLREVLDLELARLPDKYRAVLVLCDLEGKTRREAARQLGLPEGTLASRLASARRALAARLGRHGIALSGGALAMALAQYASAALPAHLVISTVKAAALVAAGQAAALATPAAALMNEVQKAMLMTKLKVFVTSAIVLVALGASGLVYRASGQPNPEPRAPEKPRTELEALRREVELLRFNLEVVLEKCRAQENELRALRGGRPKAAQGEPLNLLKDLLGGRREEMLRQEQARFEAERAALELEKAKVEQDRVRRAADVSLSQVEEALKNLGKAGDPAARKHAIDVLERALRTLRDQEKPRGLFEPQPK